MLCHIKPRTQGLGHSTIPKSHPLRAVHIRVLPSAVHLPVHWRLHVLRVHSVGVAVSLPQKYFVRSSPELQKKTMHLVALFTRDEDGHQHL